MEQVPRSSDETARNRDASLGLRRPGHGPVYRFLDTSRRKGRFGLYYFVALFLLLNAELGDDSGLYVVVMFVVFIFFAIVLDFVAKGDKNN